MNAERAVAVRTQYPARPGCRVIVVTDLNSLRGPSGGTVELPLGLYWSGTSPVFDLAVMIAAARKVQPGSLPEAGGRTLQEQSQTTG